MRPGAGAAMIRVMPQPFTTVRDPFLSLFQSAAAAFARLRPMATTAPPFTR